ncbi:hypothetical protein SCLCIDRAFT_421657 [Scleroderma citrinum Foug A]|uniref:Uncharacterized protein n=1 Tax=Scleroderma citrinum Foug A TaxID=1036808 RepID=A0A0C2ZWP2_9AGAM|nr:hypothetical protein SCLCIDRAFT_421657 [Scleroderma citrinum Foug A]
MHSHSGKQIPCSQYQDMSYTWIFKSHTTEYHRQQTLVNYIDRSYTADRHRHHLSSHVEFRHAESRTSAVQ